MSTFNGKEQANYDTVQPKEAADERAECDAAQYDGFGQEICPVVRSNHEACEGSTSGSRAHPSGS